MNYIFIILIITLSCSAPDKSETIPVNLDLQRKNIPISESFNIKYLYSENGKFKAKTAMNHILEYIDERTKNNYLIADKGIVMEFYDSTGRSESKLTANYAKLYNKMSTALFTGKVVVQNNKGEKLETEQLTWDKITNKITSPTFVKITTQKEIILGDGLESDTQFQQYNIKKTRGTISFTD